MDALKNLLAATPIDRDIANLVASSLGLTVDPETGIVTLPRGLLNTHIICITPNFMDERRAALKGRTP